MSIVTVIVALSCLVIGVVLGMSLMALLTVSAYHDREAEELEALGAESDIRHLDGELP